MIAKQKTKTSPKTKKINFWVSPLFFILAFFLVFFGYGYVFVSHITALVIHEFAHAAVAKRLGLKLDGIKLMPYGASLTGQFELARPKDEILIALAGPLVNFILVILFIALWWLVPVAYLFTYSFVYVNLGTAFFNLLPVFPLDGGRALLAGLSLKYPRQKVYKRMRIAGLISAVVFAALFFLMFFFEQNLSLAFIALFFFLSTLFPDKNSKYKRLYSMAYRTEKLKKGIKVVELVVSNDATILSLTRMQNPNYFYRYTVLDQSHNILMTVTELQLEEYAIKFGMDYKIGNVGNFD
ncbi:MAG: site-2 protease family protein [Firmicutes bacterium]|nr:site-2 protease family protein [Bacillota bacterium]